MSSKPTKVLLGFFALAVAAVAIYIAMSMNEKPYLLFLSGAGMKVPVTEIANNFEEESGIKVYTLWYAGKFMTLCIIQIKACGKKNMRSGTSPGSIEKYER